MNDLISRQDAIDALGDEPEVWTGKDEYAQGLNNQWHYDRNAILRCPSAQPEIVRCKDCAYGEKLPDNIRCELHDYLRFDYEDFCSMGVKRVTGC